MPSELIAWTVFNYKAPSVESQGFVPDPNEINPNDGQQLAEYAGRACYQSFGKPNPATATNAGYLEHILEVGHLSVLEHGTCTFNFWQVSRSFTHELIRHRHFSYSQLSQRYCEPTEDDGIVAHPTMNAEEMAQAQAAQADALYHYNELYKSLLARGYKGKQARQVARMVLPNQTPTQIVVTGNYRAWRHFLAMRTTLAADVEIREEALWVLKQLIAHAPNVFGDFVIMRTDSGENYAESKYTWES